jgi:molybdopterin-guanine dinucleotide biosynthesis protein A
VLACDLPLLDSDTVRHLVSHRNSYSLATSYENPHDNLPEPLICIWEPKSYPVLLSFLADGYSCPRKVLRNTDVTLITAIEANALTNVNTEEDVLKAKELLQKKIASL